MTITRWLLCAPPPGIYETLGSTETILHEFVHICSPHTIYESPKCTPKKTKFRIHQSNVHSVLLYGVLAHETTRYHYTWKFPEHVHTEDSATVLTWDHLQHQTPQNMRRTFASSWKGGVWKWTGISSEWQVTSENSVDDVDTIAIQKQPGCVNTGHICLVLAYKQL